MILLLTDFLTQTCVFLLVVCISFFWGWYLHGNFLGVNECYKPIRFMFAQVTEASIEQKFEGILRLNSNRYYKALSDQVVRVKSGKWCSYFTICFSFPILIKWSTQWLQLISKRNKFQDEDILNVKHFAFLVDKN